MNDNKGDIETLVNYRLTRAWETLKDARLMIEKGSYLSAVNRIYYACFYSVIAVLLKLGMSPKSHTGVRALLGKHLGSES